MRFFKRWIRHALVIAGNGVLVSAALAQTAPIPANAVTFSPTIPQEFEPFTVTIDFSKPYCVAENSPLFSRVSLVGTELVLLLSQLGDGPCASRKSFVVPGIPAGSFRVTVGVAGPYWPNYPAGTREAVSVEQSTVALVVNAIGQKSPLYTWVAPMEPRASSGLFLVPGVPTATTQNGNISLVGASDEFEFMAWLGRLSSVPKAAVRLYWLDYPKPLNGSFRTTSLADANRLIGDGFTLKTDSLEEHVLPKANGACPLGSKPVYRLFNPRVIAHRYVTSLDTYNALAANGWIGEGSVFCAPGT
jgi:Repeat of unknown function (DUF5648)